MFTVFRIHDVLKIQKQGDYIVKAYLFLVHNDPIHFSRILKNIDDGESDVYVHLDKKVDSDDFINHVDYNFNGKIIYIKDRISVIWGDFSMVVAMINLIKSAIKTDYQHLIFLSGSDYTIKSKNIIKNYFNNNKGKELIRAYNLSDNKCKHCEIKIRKYWNIRISNKTILANKIISILLITLSKIFKKGKYVELNGKLQPVYYGSQWFSITLECARYILETLDVNPKYINYFKHSFAPDEMFFHTIIFNSKYKDCTTYGKAEQYSGQWNLNNYTYLKNHELDCNDRFYKDNTNIFYNLTSRFTDKKDKTDNTKISGSISFLNEDDFSEIEQSKYMFARKFNSNISYDLVKKIDKLIEENGYE